MSKPLYLISLFFFGIAFLCSCKNNKKSSPVNTEFGNLSQQEIDTLKSIGQPLQLFEISPEKDTILSGKNGTRLFIEANSIVNDKGEPMTGKVTIELKEHYSIADFITSNLQTVHNNDILQTQGMIYLNATMVDGSRLFIDTAKPIRIEFPVSFLAPGTSIFKGRRDEDGNMNWSEIEETNKMLIPFPIHSLAPREDGECRRNFGITDDPEFYRKWSGNTYLTFDTLSKYENTLLATREFKFRYYSFCMPALTNIYIANLGKNMWEIDELMVKYFIKDSTERVDYQLNNPPPTYGGRPVTKEQLQAHQWLIDHDKEWGHRMIEMFKSFAAQKLLTVDTTKKTDTAIIRESRQLFQAYNARQFGWMNVDYFYNDPKAEKLRLVAKTNEPVFTINLVLPGRNIILAGIPHSDGTYWFTKQEDGYNKLPKGERAIIECISIVNNKLHFADKDIIIGQNETENLELKETTATMISERMKSYGQRDTKP